MIEEWEAEEAGAGTGVRGRVVYGDDDVVN
jgi:hypothetical protein